MLIDIEMDLIMLSKPLMTTHEVAELLKVSEATVRTWIHEGELRAIRIGREFRISAEDLEAFLNERATRPVTTAPRPTRSNYLQD